MYKNLTQVKPDTRDPEVQRKELVNYITQKFLDNDANRYGVSKALHDKVTVGQYSAIRQCAELNATDIKKTLDKKEGTFKNDYSKVAYILALLKKKIPQNIESAKPNFRAQQEPPQASIQKRPAWMDELETESKLSKVEQLNKRLTYAQRQNLKNFPDGDIPVITDTDLFEPDPIHEAWAKLSADQRRKNREKAIAEHRQSHPPKVYSDEIY